MKRLPIILALVVAVAATAVPFFGQSQDAAVSGRVTGRDGNPAPDIQIWIDSLVTNNGRLQIRERLEAKTGRNGEYSKSGLYQGRVMITVIENGQPVMVKGEKVGDEIFLASGIDYRANFDLREAPPPVAATPALPDGASAADREALRKKLEADAAAQGEISKNFEAAKVAFNAKNYTEAITLFKAAADKIPTPAPAGMDVVWANLARAYDADKQYEEAETAYLKAIELKPKEPAAMSNYYLNLSLIQITLGKLDEGTASIKMAADLNPANAGVAYYNLGATLINRNRPKEAIDILKRAVELDPTYANAYYQLGLTMIGQNQMAEAEPYLTKFIELAPTSPDAATAKALIEATKAPGVTSFSTPEADSKAKQPAKNKGR